MMQQVPQDLQPVLISNNPHEDHQLIVDKDLGSLLRFQFLGPCALFVSTCLLAGFVPSSSYHVSQFRHLPSTVGTSRFVQASLFRLSPSSGYLAISFFLHNLTDSAFLLSGAFNISCLRNNITVSETQSAFPLMPLTVIDSQAAFWPLLSFNILDFDSLVLSLRVSMPHPGPQLVSFDFAMVSPLYSMIISTSRLVFSALLIPYLLFGISDFSPLCERRLTFLLSFFTILVNDPFYILHSFNPSATFLYLHRFFHVLYFSYLCFYVLAISPSESRIRRFVIPGLIFILNVVVFGVSELRSAIGQNPAFGNQMASVVFDKLPPAYLYGLGGIGIGILVNSALSSFTGDYLSSIRSIIYTYSGFLILGLTLCISALGQTVEDLNSVTVFISMALRTSFALVMEYFHVESEH
jgi:hypothetical protein